MSKKVLNMTEVCFRRWTCNSDLPSFVGICIEMDNGNVMVMYRNEIRLGRFESTDLL